MRWKGPGVAAILGLLAGGGASAQTDCNRACLTGFVDTFYTALAANTPATVPLAATAKITHNGRVMKLDQAFWANAETTVYRFDIADPTTGNVASEAVVLNADGSKTMYMVRLKVLAAKITEVEIIKTN